MSDQVCVRITGRVVVKLLRKISFVMVFGVMLASCASQGGLEQFSQEQKNTLLLKYAGEGNLVYVDKLILSQADVNFVDERGQTALYLSASNGLLPVVRRLIEAGAYVNQLVYGKTLLHHAVESNYLIMAQMLVAAGADTSIKSDDGQTPIELAEQKGFKDLELLLADFASKN